MAADSNPLRDRILKTLGQQGALSLKGITTILRPQDPKTIETELKTMVRRKLAANPFEGSFELTERGRKDYKELVKHIPKHTAHPQAAPFGGFPMDQEPYGPPMQFEQTDEDDEEDEEDEEYCEDCDWPIDQCHCDDEEDEDDDDDDLAY